MANKWKITAIVFITLFVLENLLIGIGIYSVIKESIFEEKMDNYCDYNVCNGSSTNIGDLENRLWGYYSMSSNTCVCMKGSTILKEIFVENLP